MRSTGQLMPLFFIICMAKQIMLNLPPIF